MSAEGSTPVPVTASEPAPSTTEVPPPADPSGSGLITAGGVVLAIAGLYFGRDIFVPFALAILLSFVLAPLTVWMRRIKVPKIAAILIAVMLAGSVIGAIGYVVAGQLLQLAGNLPTYQQTIKTKLQTLRTSAPGGGVVEQVTDTIKDLSQELSGDNKASPAPGQLQPPAGQPTSRAPIPVTIEQGEVQPLQVIQSVLGPLIAPLATAGLVVVFVIFILIEREDLRDRFIKLVGAGDLQTSTEAINEAAGRVSRYLLMQLMVNLTYGVPLGLGLYLIGVPNALLWGLLAALLRFVPYLGPFLAALFPVALAFAVDSGWSMLGWTVGLFLTLELISNNVVEPWLYGASTGLSSLAIIMAAIFWTTLWGPVGLFLSTPLTVCLVVIGRYVPKLEFLGVMLGSDPVLAPEERFYQRLLAGNVEEAVEIAEDVVDEASALRFYDEVALPALRLAETDRRRNTSDVNYRRIVAQGATAVVREVADHLREKQHSATAPDPEKPASVEGELEEGGRVRQQADAQPTQTNRRMTVLCIGGRSGLDLAAAEMMAQTLADEAGFAVRVLPPRAVAQDALGRLDLTGVDVVCLSYLHPRPEVYARYVFRRLKRRAPGVRLLACLWSTGAATAADGDTAERLAADGVATSIAAAGRQIDSWARDRGPVPERA